MSLYSVNRNRSFLILDHIIFECYRHQMWNTGNEEMKYGNKIKQRIGNEVTGGVIA